MRRDDGGEFWNIIVGAGIGALSGVGGQFISDIVSSAVNGEWSISSVSSYIGAAIGGAVGGAVAASGIPGGDVIGDIVGTMVTTSVGMIGNNIEGIVRGTGSKYTADEIFCTTFENTILSTITSVGIRNSKIGKTLDTRKIFNKNISGKNVSFGMIDMAFSGVMSYFDGIRNSRPFSMLSSFSHRW